MGLASGLIFLNVAIFSVTVLVIIYAYPFRRLFAVQMLLLLTLSFCLISFCNLNVYVAQSLEAKIFFSRNRFLGLSLLGPSWLLFISSVYETWKFLQRRWMLGVLFGPALITILFTIIPQFRDLVVTNFTPFTSQGLSVVKFEGGAWFSFHIAWSYFLILLSFILSAAIYIQGNVAKKKQIFILTFGGLIAAGIDVYGIVTDSSSRWLMLSGGTFLVNEAAIIYAVFRHRLLDLAPFAIEKIFQDIPDPVLVVDSKNRLRATNQAAQRLFKMNMNSFGRKLTELLPDINLSEGEVTLKDDKNLERCFYLSIEKFAPHMEESSGSIIFFREITTQKGIETRLNESLEFKARLLSLIAHDLSGNIKNQAMLSSLLQNQIRPEFKDVASLLTESTFASQDLMENILVWARSQEAKFIPVKKRFELNALIADCIDTVQTASALKGVKIIVTSDQRPLILNGDSGMISAVIRNILSNSIRATNTEGHPIVIEINSQENSIKISVKDMGIGMTAEQLESIKNSSDQFFSDARAVGKGYGIGLKIARRFVELHGGQFSIDSQLGIGTTVSFSIPV